MSLLDEIRERLPEEKLVAWAGEQATRRGYALFLAGLAEIEYANQDDVAVIITEEKREVQVVFVRAGTNINIMSSCGHHTVCGHITAAILAVHGKPMEMSMHWTRFLRYWETAIKPAKQRLSNNPYWLFLAFEPMYSRIHVQPYRLWLHNFPGNILPTDRPLDMPLLADLLEHNPWLSSAYIRELRGAINKKACANLEEDAVTLAGLIAQAGPQTTYYRFYNAYMDLGALLLLGAQRGIPMALKKKEAFSALTVVLDAEPMLSLAREQDALALVSTWGGHTPDGQTIQFTWPEKQRIFSVWEGKPHWLLAEPYLIQVKDTLRLGGDLSNLVFRAQASKVTVPPQDINTLQEMLPGLRGKGIALELAGGESQIIRAKPLPQLYLSEEDGEFRASMRFSYDGYVVPYQKSMPTESITWDLDRWRNIRIIREPEEEKRYYKIARSTRGGLKQGGAMVPDDILLLRANVDAVDFLLKKVPALLKEGFEIYGEENLASVRVNRHPPSISLNVSSGIDWFDLRAAVKFGETEVDWKELRRAIRKRERYVKLADGSIGEIPKDWLKRFRHLFGMSEDTEEGLRMSSQQVVLLDQLLEEMDEFHVDDEFQRRRERLRNFSGIKEVPLPAGFQGTLYPYQKAGYNWLHFLHEYEFGGCLADDMGLGKTVQVLTFLLSLREFGHAQTASLIVVPRSLMVNWQREAARFTPGLKVLLHFGPGRTKKTADFDAYDLVITTYGVMLRDVAMLRKYRFHYIVLDESQAIKNPMAKTSRAARRLNSDHRLVMTGTPVENTTFELWSQFAFINPGLLGNLTYFRSEFGTPIEKNQDEQTSQLLRNMVYPFILRRTKEQVAPELPPRTERIIYCDMLPEQEKLYLHTRDFYRAQLLGILDEQGMDGARMKILEGLLRLRQICNHPRLVKETYRDASGKLNTILEMMETLRIENHRALVFSQFVQMLSLLRKALDERGIPYEYLDGSTSNRQARVDNFQKREDIPFFLISLKAGGVGLNLTAADYVLHVDPWWNPAVEMQATDRSHRIGQDKPVFVYRFITRNTVEEKILQLQERKKNLVRQLITTEGAFFKNLTSQDVQVLFG